MKIAVFSAKSHDREYFEKLNDKSKLQIVYFDASLDESTVKLVHDVSGVCVFVNDDLNARVLEELKSHGVKLIALRCAGFNNVDLSAAERLQIQVVRVPAYFPESIAEHAVALILTLNRKTHKAYNRVREGNFSVKNLSGFNLCGKTVGVIGTGKIGLALCRILKGFGCSLLAYDIHEQQEALEIGVQYVSLEYLVSEADIISLHCPLNDKTHHLIDAKLIAKMKDGVMLINTGRGALIHTEDATDALKTQKIGYLGIDVYEQEEHLFFQDLSEVVIQDDLIMRLVSFPNVLITSHQAFLTKESLEQITTITLQNILDFQEGKPLANALTNLGSTA